MIHLYVWTPLSNTGNAGVCHKFRFKVDLKDAVRKKAAGGTGGNPGQCPLLYWSSGILMRSL